MTDRHVGFVVTLDSPRREDDTDATIRAILEIKGVVAVMPVKADPGLMIARISAAHELHQKLIKFCGDLISVEFKD